MCLSAVKQRREQPLKRTRTAYKVFVRGRSVLRGPYHGGSVRPGRWLVAQQRKVLYGGGSGSYVSGFHVFVNRQDAESYGSRQHHRGDTVVVPVKVRDVRTIGFQHGFAALVCDRMFVSAAAVKAALRG